MARTFTSVVAEALGDDFAESKYGTRVGTWLNDALKLMARSSRIPLAEATSTPTIVAGTSSYPLPADFIRLVEVWNTATRDPLTEADPAWINDQAVASGVPYAYALSGNTIVFYPTPSAATTLQLRYIKTSADLSGTGAISGVIPDEYGDALVAYCRWHLFRAEDDIEMSVFWKNEFNETFQKLRADLQMRSNAVRQIPGPARSRAPRFARP